MNQDPMIVIEQKDENKKRGALAVILAIAFVAILAIGGTFAYLTYTANQTPNRFTTGELTADLLEPTWNKAAVENNGGTLAKDGTITGTVKANYVSGDGTLIPHGAAGQLPGSTVSKNPFVVNTSTNADVKGFAGIKLQFQKWNKTETGDAGGSWVDCSEDEVKHILAVYNIESTATNNNEDKVAGITSLGDSWSQFKKSDGSAVTTTGSVSENGAMYFVNSTSLKSLGSLTTAVTEDATSDTWGYTCGGSDAYATTELFKTVTFCKGASQANINTLLGDLDPTTTTVTSGTFTPGWRLVVSGAIIQDVGQTLGADYYKTLAGLLDAKSDVNRGQSTKPTKATGARSTSTLGTWYKNTAEGVAQQAGNGVSEATNEGPSA